MRHTYQCKQWLPYSVELVFAFFANPENLPPLMPEWQQARIEEAAITPPPPRPSTAAGPGLQSVAAGAGTRMTLSFRPFPLSPIRVTWDAEITEFAWNEYFCDQQLRGPFAYWHHCHSVVTETRPDQKGVVVQGTLLSDRVEYEVPFGRLGEMANVPVIQRQFRSLFEYRHRRTLALLSAFARQSRQS